MSNPNQQEIDRLVPMLRRCDKRLVQVDEERFLATHNQVADPAVIASLDTRRDDLIRERRNVKALMDHYKSFH